MWPSVFRPVSPYSTASGSSPIPTLSKTIQMIRSNAAIARLDGKYTAWHRMGNRQALEANRRPHRIFRWGHLLGIVLLYEQRCMGGGTHSPRSTGVGPRVGVKLMGSRLESYSVGSLLAPAFRLSCD